MQLTIHRGTKEIGGSCVEIVTSKTRIIIDFGMPLVDRDGSEFNFRNYKSLSVEDLILKKVLPDIKGLYESSKENPPDAIIISHPHIDHYGFTHFINKNIPIYLGKATKELIDLTAIFTSQPFTISVFNYFDKLKPFVIGNIKITPYYNDHSAFDSYGFLIEGEEKQIYYSGDFRAHGWDKNVFNSFLNNPPVNVDCLLMEGTTMSRNAGTDKTEKEIQSELENYFKEDKINLIYSSGQNIDRIISVYEACISTNKTLIIDFYIANVLKIISEFTTIPHPDKNNPNIKVIFPYRLSRKMVNEGYGKLLYNFKSFKITKPEIDTNPGKYVLFVRPSMKLDLDYLKNINGGNLIYSLWKGYLKKKDTKEFIEYLKSRNFQVYEIHTSGHADVDTLKAMVEAIKPKLLIPIHTFEPDKYKTTFNVPVKELEDGIPFDII
jgi:ribonuclease J